MKKIIIIGLLLITSGTITPKLIEIGPLPENTTVDEETGLKIQDNKIFLDTHAGDTVLGETYAELIEAQQTKGLPYIFAIITTANPDNKNLYSAYDAHGLNKFLFEAPATNRQYFWNRYNPADLAQKQFNDYKRRPIINRISYYLIDTIDGTAATMLGTDYDLLEDPTKKNFMQTFFKANLNDADAQSDLGDLFEKKDDLKQAKHYYTLSAHQNNAGGQFNLGSLFEREDNFEQAKKYYALAANQLDQYGQHGLGSLLEKEGKLDEAKRYYLLAAEQGHALAQYDLGALLEEEGKLEKAKRYYQLAVPDEPDAQEALRNLEAKIAATKEREPEPSTSSKKRQRED